MEATKSVNLRKNIRQIGDASRRWADAHFWSLLQNKEETSHQEELCSTLDPVTNSTTTINPQIRVNFYCSDWKLIQQSLIAFRNDKDLMLAKLSKLLSFSVSICDFDPQLWVLFIKNLPRWCNKLPNSTCKVV